jgi:predicted transcriptional regulator
MTNNKISTTILKNTHQNNAGGKHYNAENKLISQLLSISNKTWPYSLKFMKYLGIINKHISTETKPPVINM